MFYDPNTGASFDFGPPFSSNFVLISVMGSKPGKAPGKFTPRCFTMNPPKSRFFQKKIPTKSII